MKCMTDGKRSGAGMDLESSCTMTGASGDQLYYLSKRSAGDVGAGGGGEGRTELMGALESMPA